MRYAFSIMIGLDIVSIERIAEKIKTPSFLEGVFTVGEILYYKDKGEKAETLAGIFAVKEAVAKAFKVGLVFRPTDIEVMHDANGAPYVVLHRQAKEIIQEKCTLAKTTMPNINVSISHDGGIAIAVCYLN